MRFLADTLNSRYVIRFQIVPSPLSRKAKAQEASCASLEIRIVYSFPVSVFTPPRPKMLYSAAKRVRNFIVVII